MFNLFYFLFEFFRNKTFSDTINNPLRIEWHDWMPDFAKGFGKYLADSFKKLEEYLKYIYELLIGSIKSLIEGAVTIIKDVIGSIVTFIKQIYEQATQFFDTILEFFADLWEWFKESVSKTYEFLSELISDFWHLVSETCVSIWESFQELLWYIGEWLFEFVLSCGDALVATCIEMILWLFDKILPAIDMPQGFEQGVTYFIQFGMLLNEILPIRETLSLFALYVTIRITVGAYRFIRTLPFGFLFGG